MKVKVTKVMTSEINKYFKKNGIGYTAYFVEYTPNEYSIYVGSTMCHEDDYDWTKNVMKAIKIAYPDSYYAMPRYLTSNDLYKLFRKCNKTLEGFMKELYSEVEI